VAGLLLLVGVALYLFRRDIEKTIARFGVFETELTVEAEAPYEDRARELSAERPETAIYCHGHTHRPPVQSVDGGLLVNSGTWLYRLHRRDGIIGLLPAIFYHSYQLTAVRIAAESAGITVEHEPIEKPSPSPEELTLTERLLTLGRKPNPDLPDPAVVEESVAVASPQAGD